jgi:ribose transport system substrate-binding protein
MACKTVTTALLAGAAMAMASAAHAEAKFTIGITQNNVGVDSYQTTYEKAFIAAADANAMVETVVLDAGGDVARQIAQMEDLIQQEVDAIIIWPTNGEAVIPAVRKAHQGRHPGDRDQLQHRRARLRFRQVVLRARQHHPGRALGRDHVRQVQGDGHRGRGPIVQISGQPGYTTAIERAEGLRGPSAGSLPERDPDGDPARRLEPREVAEASWRRSSSSMTTSTASIPATTTWASAR